MAKEINRDEIISPETKEALKTLRIKVTIAEKAISDVEKAWENFTKINESK